MSAPGPCLGRAAAVDMIDSTSPPPLARRVAVGLLCAERAGAAAARRGLARAGDAQQLVDRVLQTLGDQVDVGQRVVVAEQAVVERAVIGHDRDGQGVVLGQEGDREQVLRARGRARRAAAAGPGTLVTIRLNRRVEKFSREAWASTVGGREVVDRGQGRGADRLL